MTTLKQLKPLFNKFKKSHRPILNNVLVDSEGIKVHDLETTLLIKDNFGLEHGLHNIETLGLVGPGDKDVEEYPLLTLEIDPVDKVKVNLEEIDTLLPFVSSDETRLQLNGIAINSNNLVACDGHTLKNKELNQNVKNDYIIPKDSLKLLSKVMKKFKIPKTNNFNIHLNEQFAVIDNHKFTLVSKLIQRDYPKWKAVIPVKYKNEIKITNWINFKELKPLFNKRTFACKLELNEGKVNLISSVFPDKKNTHRRM